MEATLERRNPRIFLGLSTILHLVGFVHFLVAIVFRTYYETNSTEDDQVKKFAYNFKYMTSVNAALQTVYNLFAFVTDLMLWIDDKKYNRLMTTRAFIRGAIAFPCGLASCIPVLTALAIRVYLLGKPVTFERPLWLVWMMYFNVICFQILDLLFSKSPNSPWVPSLFCTVALCCLFLLWEQVIYICTGIYANVPILQDANTISKMVLYMSICFIWITIMVLGRCMNDLFWNPESQAYEMCTCRGHVAN